MHSSAYLVVDTLRNMLADAETGREPSAPAECQVSCLVPACRAARAAIAFALALVMEYGRFAGEAATPPQRRPVEGLRFLQPPFSSLRRQRAVFVVPSPPLGASAYQLHAVYPSHAEYPSWPASVLHV